MSETKTFVVPDNLTGNNDNLATMAMMNGGFGGGMWNNPFMYLVWMYIMRCIEEMQSKDYNEKYGRRRYPREEYRDPDYNRYF